MKTRAFTLIELLVVISIIAILMAVLMPALRLAKQQAATGQCLGNVKNLSLGWYMYMGENDGDVMSCEDLADAAWIRIPEDENGTPQDIFQQNPEVTDEDEIRGIKKGVLFPYVSDPGTYHCPSSFVTSLYDRSRVFVSYSIPYCYNRSENRTTPQIRSFNQIRNPSTSYVFVETGETRNWNSSHHFIMASPEVTGTPRWGWWGPMSINHGKGSVLGFADGHAEVRKWRDKFTIERVSKLETTGATTYGQEYPDPEQTLDIDYMAQGWAYKPSR